MPRVIPFQPCTPDTLQRVLACISKRCYADAGDAEVYAMEINSMLDGLLNDDYFGPEGQKDPRGDHRAEPPEPGP